MEMGDIDFGKPSKTLTKGTVFSPGPDDIEQVHTGDSMECLRYQPCSTALIHDGEVKFELLPVKVKVSFSQGG